MPELSSESEAEEAASTPELWGDRYRREVGSWTDFTARLEKLVTDLLREARIDVVQIESRTKSVDSFVGKVKRKADKYEDPLREITDLSGLRIITYYAEDVDEVVELLKTEFHVDLENSRGTIRAEHSEHFGYQSAQYVLRVSEARRRLVEWKQFGKRSAEVQVRTALQHGWSAIEHKLSYKAEREVPRHLKRKLSRLSALLELADEEFSALRDAIDDLSGHYAAEIDRGHLDVDVDAESVDVYANSERAEAHLSEIVRTAGFHVEDSDEGVVQRDRRDLLRALQLLQVETIESLDEILRNAASNWAKPFLADLSRHSDDAGMNVLQGTTFDLVLMLVLFAERADHEVVVAAGYNESFQEILGRLIETAKDGSD